MHARPLASVAVGALLLTGLTGCEKPTPGVTVFSGDRSVHEESTTFCRAGQSPAKQDCVQHLSRFGLLRVKPGSIVGIDVDSSIAKHGWVLIDTDAKARSNVLVSHYFSYTPDFSQRPIVHLEVRSLDRATNDADVTGIWKFQLVEE